MNRRIFYEIKEAFLLPQQHPQRTAVVIIRIRLTSGGIFWNTTLEGGSKKTIGKEAEAKSAFALLPNSSSRFRADRPPPPFLINLYSSPGSPSIAQWSGRQRLDGQPRRRIITVGICILQPLLQPQLLFPWWETPWLMWGKIFNVPHTWCD